MDLRSLQVGPKSPSCRWWRIRVKSSPGLRPASRSPLLFSSNKPKKKRLTRMNADVRPSLFEPCRMRLLRSFGTHSAVGIREINWRALCFNIRDIFFHVMCGPHHHGSCISNRLSSRTHHNGIFFSCTLDYLSLIAPYRSIRSHSPLSVCLSRGRRGGTACLCHQKQERFL